MQNIMNSLALYDFLKISYTPDQIFGILSSVHPSIIENNKVNTKSDNYFYPPSSKSKIGLLIDYENWLMSDPNKYDWKLRLLLELFRVGIDFLAEDAKKNKLSKPNTMTIVSEKRGVLDVWKLIEVEGSVCVSTLTDWSEFDKLVEQVKKVV
ncbi:hypothetical protein [Rhodoferax aquaticus]|uniref:Uncharacterized protein n=1 Tax=Rhodoferax aquaticus TaxID=2527691 RepID=A0A515EQP8_9BURK|nr:hypothetical protein [Rhodoferax aquaticus]QDL54993.1 hypothetical protein EXZ61_12920 [Rhodoferax aquaticus]